MKIRTVAATFGALGLLVSACAIAPATEGEAVGTVQQSIQKSDPRKVYAHLMPWFETPGFHWDMVGRHYNPQIGPYHSGDSKVIEYQLLLMKYAGIDGVIIDWPGRSTVNKDLPANAENTDQIIAQTAKFGMEFAVCFEDQYAADAGDAINSMHWVKDHYFNQPNHIKVNGAPALFVFGPQKIAAGDWPSVLAATGADPVFFTLWYNDKGGAARDGTFGWLFSDGLTGVKNYYDRSDQGTKVPVIYPGFNAAYANGAPGWSIPYDLNGDTFTAVYNLSKGVGNLVQIATWNDYTEGTMIEPTNELGYRYLTTLQKLLGVRYGQGELEIVRKLYDLRKAGDATKAEAASQALIKLDVAGACAQLGCTAPVHTGAGGSASGTAGASPGAAGTPAVGGKPSTSGTAGASAVGGSGTGTGGSGSVVQPAGGTPPVGTAGDSGETGDSGDKSHDSGGCSTGPARPSSSGALFAAAALLMVAKGRRR